MAKAHEPNENIGKNTKKYKLKQGSKSYKVNSGLT